MFNKDQNLQKDFEHCSLCVIIDLTHITTKLQKITKYAFEKKLGYECGHITRTEEEATSGRHSQHRIHQSKYGICHTKLEANQMG